MDLKKILIMRHAKSSWNNGSLKDFDRPLNERGMKDAPRMGKYLKEQGIIPDQLIGSPALRAKQTLLKLSDELGFDHEKIIWDEDLYFRSSLSYIHALNRMKEQSSVVLIAGHYPMVSDVVSKLAGRELTEHFSTATIACLEAEIDQWENLDEGMCKLKWMKKPKQLKGI